MFGTTARLVRGAAIVLLLCLAPLHPAAAKERTSVDAAVAALDPGEFFWKPKDVPAGPVEIVVSLPLQTAYVYRSGRLIGASTVSTGKPGHETPVGRFEILQKRKEHYSNRYDNAPMPYMQRLTWYGIALHGGAIPGYPASHGCVRLPLAFARKLYAETKLGGTVAIIDQAPRSAEAALALGRAAPPSVELASAP